MNDNRHLELSASIRHVRHLLMPYRRGGLTMTGDAVDALAGVLDAAANVAQLLEYAMLAAAVTRERMPRLGQGLDGALRPADAPSCNVTPFTPPRAAGRSAPGHPQRPESAPAGDRADARHSASQAGTAQAGPVPETPDGAGSGAPDAAAGGSSCAPGASAAPAGHPRRSVTMLPIADFPPTLTAFETREFLLLLTDGHSTKHFAAHCAERVIWVPVGYGGDAGYLSATPRQLRAGEELSASLSIFEGLRPLEFAVLPARVAAAKPH